MRLLGRRWRHRGKLQRPREPAWREGAEGAEGVEGAEWHGVWTGWEPPCTARSGKGGSTCRRLWVGAREGERGAAGAGVGVVWWMAEELDLAERLLRR